MCPVTHITHESVSAADTHIKRNPKQQRAALMTTQVAFCSHSRVKKKERANTFLTTVDASLQCHTDTHDRHQALSVIQINRLQNAKIKGKI